MRRAATLALGNNDDIVEERYLQYEDDSVGGGAGKDMTVHVKLSGVMVTTPSKGLKRRCPTQNQTELTSFRARLPSCPQV